MSDTDTRYAAAIWRECPSLPAAEAWLERLKVLRLVADANPVLMWDVELPPAYTGARVERVQAAVFLDQWAKRYSRTTERIYDCSEDFIAGWMAAACVADAEARRKRDEEVAAGLKRREAHDRGKFGSVAAVAQILHHDGSLKKDGFVVSYDGYYLDITPPADSRTLSPSCQRAKDAVVAAELFLEEYVKYGAEKYIARRGVE